MGTRIVAAIARLLLYVAGTLLVLSLALCGLAIYLSTLPARKLSTSSQRRAAGLAAVRDLVAAGATLLALQRAGNDDGG